MSYEHSYEQYSFVYKSRRGEEVDGIYKDYICHYNFFAPPHCYSCISLHSHRPACHIEEYETIALLYIMKLNLSNNLIIL